MWVDSGSVREHMSLETLGKIVTDGAIDIEGLQCKYLSLHEFHMGNNALE